MKILRIPMIKFDYQHIADWTIENDVLKSVNVEAEVVLKQLGNQEPAVFYEWLRANGWIKKPS